MMTEKDEKELYFAKSVLNAIRHVEHPILVYQEEKDVVSKALGQYISKLEEKRYY